MTIQQSRLLQFIADYQSMNAGASPSHQEMGAALGLKSKSGIFRILTALEEQGCITRLANRARSIRIIRPAITADAFRASFEQLVKQEGADVAAGILQDLARGLMPRAEGVR